VTCRLRQAWDIRSGVERCTSISTSSTAPPAKGTLDISGVIDSTYFFSLWAPSVGPMGISEHAIILMTVQILEEEAA
jgi:hypothetical protein